MKRILQSFLALALGAVAVLPMLGQAEDIDVYTGVNSAGGVPNVLFVIDTGANFSSSAAQPCTAYSDGSGDAPSLGDTAGGVEQCALVNAINALDDGSVNIGILVNNNNNFATDSSRVPVYTDGVADPNPASHEVCEGTYGGCLARKLQLMTDGANGGKAKLINFIKSWKLSGSNSNTEFNVKSGGDRTANSMQEAWAYYRGKVGMSGKSYADDFVGTGCQKNFVIFIGNSFNTSGGPADGGSQSPYNGTNALTSAQVGAEASLLAKVKGLYGVADSHKYDPVEFEVTTCGVNELANTTVASNWSENWADEWARLMYRVDASADLDGTQNITTYTIGVINNNANTCKADYPALLTAMAGEGGGDYYQTGNAVDLANAINAILNEIQAVNSVFASASLPVSVNAQGTYLNQIFLGMFRPDADGDPRWLGNLKQYQFILSNATDPNSDLILGDASGAPAISSAGTGFITPNAVSFWTQDSEADPDNVVDGGFFQNDSETAADRGGYDSPDGELVERGGAAQQARIENITGDARRMYTYCPSGASCVAALTDTTNAFTTANAGIVSTAFGTSTAVQINSLVRTGTEAEVITAGSHGFTLGVSSVTISNSDQSEYNASFTANACATPADNCFKISGLPDRPTTPALGAYTVATPGASSVGVSSLVRNESATGTANSETVTVTTSAAHGFAAGSTVNISGVTPSGLGGNYTIAVPDTGSCPAATCFTYQVPVYPPASTGSTFSASVDAYARAISSISVASAGSARTATASTTIAHGFHVGQSISISGTSNNTHNSPFVVATVPSTTTFTFNYSGGSASNSTGGSVVPDSTLQALTVTRVGTTNTVTVTATGAPSGWFGATAGATKSGVSISETANANTTLNDGAYAQNGVTISCLTAGCTQFTYSVSTSPQASGSGSITASTPSGSSVTVAAGSITRNGATATVSGLTPSLFGTVVGDTAVVEISVSGTAYADEAAYLGSKTITCSTALCTSATFPVTTAPVSPATGTNMTAFAPGTPPDKDTLIAWLRGADNFGDEEGPGTTDGTTPVHVRPSIHGDVLHSRPVVVNYSASGPLVVYYGSNDGTFRAVNGSQDTDISGSPDIPPGGELWSLVLSDHYGKLNRQRVNSPELKLSTTSLSGAAPKDYFVDGSPGIYQRLNADGSVAEAVIYLIMRRGGRFIMAIDVTSPMSPSVKWIKRFSDAGFGELGQTWSRPRLTLIEWDRDQDPDPANDATPLDASDDTEFRKVVVFGAGYDINQDDEPPSYYSATASGRGLFMVDADTGDIVWSASVSCATPSTATCLNVPEMKHSIPSDVVFVDRDNNGITDRIYVGDLGGNVWRADVNAPIILDTTTATYNWKVTRVAALGCNDGAPAVPPASGVGIVCSDGKSPRKFFFPPSVVSVKAIGSVGSYDAIMIASGDREHPIRPVDDPIPTTSSYLVNDRVYMIKDPNTALGSGADLNYTSYEDTDADTVEDDGGANASLVDVSNTSYKDLGFPGNGFYISFATGEKAVNAPLTVFGTTFFGTNQPSADDANSCTADLGIATGYAVSPFTGEFGTNVYDGGGLPPSPVTGLVTVTYTDENGDEQEILKKFCIGCGGSTEDDGGDCNSALENCAKPQAIDKNPRRTYWYKKK